MEVAAPAFGEVKASCPSCHGGGGLIHRNEIGIHALRNVQPMFLANVGGEGEALLGVD